MVIGTKTELQKRVGEAVRRFRLSENLSQATLAERSGVSLNAVRHLESGAGATLSTFIQVTRTLGKTRWLDDFGPSDEISPIAFAEALAKGRKMLDRKRAGRQRGARS